MSWSQCNVCRSMLLRMAFFATFGNWAFFFSVGFFRWSVVSNGYALSFAVSSFLKRTYEKCPGCKMFVGLIPGSGKSVLNSLIVQIVEGWITQWRWKVYNLKQFRALAAIAPAAPTSIIITLNLNCPQCPPAPVRSVQRVHTVSSVSSVHHPGDTSFVRHPTNTWSTPTRSGSHS